MTATEELCHARQLGAHFTVISESALKVSSPLPLPRNLTAELRKHKPELLVLLRETPDYSISACICEDSTGLTGSKRCGVCALALICPHCSRCRGCKRVIGLI